MAAYQGCWQEAEAPSLLRQHRGPRSSARPPAPSGGHEHGQEVMKRTEGNKQERERVPQSVRWQGRVAGRAARRTCHQNGGRQRGGQALRQRADQLEQLPAARLRAVHRRLRGQTPTSAPVHGFDAAGNAGRHTCPRRSLPTRPTPAYASVTPARSCMFSVASTRFGLLFRFHFGSAGCCAPLVRL